MRRMTSFLIFGTIAASSLFTLYVGSRLQNGQCAEITLPMNVQFSLGTTCPGNRPIAMNSAANR
jgi:hypothetical protein